MREYAPVKALLGLRNLDIYSQKKPDRRLFS